MKILITGSRGMIGSKLFKKVIFQYPFVDSIDLKDGQNLLTCELPDDIDVVFHLAAQTSVEASWYDPLHDLDNIRLTARLVQKYPKAKIIYANSAASQDPQSPYGFSKMASGEYLKRFHSNYVSLVFPNVYGGSQSVVDIFKSSNTLTIFGDGLQVRDYVHVDDIVDGLMKAVTWNKGEYFMGSGIPTTVLDLAHVLPHKSIIMAPARKEARESVLPNTTPNWSPVIKVLDYLHG